GGSTWARAGNYPAGVNDGRFVIAIAKSNSQVLYSSIVAPYTHTLLEIVKSSDGGTTWTPLANVPNYMGSQGLFDTALAVNPTDANNVYAGGTTIVESTDGGTSWADISVGAAGNNGPHQDHHALAFDANGRLLDGTDGGIWLLDNPAPGSIHWTDLN